MLIGAKVTIGPFVPDDYGSMYQRAIGIYKAAGFRVEGRLKKCFFIDGAWVDVLLMAAFRPSRKRRNRTSALAQNEANSSDHIAVRQFEAA
jgi:hypothetical protein